MTVVDGTRASSGMRRRSSVAAIGLVALAAVALPTVGSAQESADEADFSGFANGTVVHAEAIELPELSDPTSIRVADADEAFSAAAVDSQGLPDQQTTEFGGTFQPSETADGTPVAGENAYGRAYGLDAAVGEEGQAQGQLTLAGLAEAVAPPPSEFVINELGPVPVDPVAYATLVRGEAQAIYDDMGACVSLGSDLAFGRGLAANAQLLDQDGTPDGDADTEELEQPLVSTQADDPDRAVASSLSHTFLAGQVDAEGTVVGDALALVSETRQTIAPVTLFGGTENSVTLEFLGEWVLRAVATGIPGTAHVTYGPGDVSPSTPVIRIIQNSEVTEILTLQDLLGVEGLVIDALPLISLAIGEDPRALGGDADSAPTIAADGTSVSAAVDVVRIRLLSEAALGEAAEIRVGHMEVSAQVPPGGLTCEIPVTKTVDEPVVQPGETFTYTITVDNPFQCPLSDVRIEDTIEADAGVKWTVTATNPEATSVTDTLVVWEGLGPIAPGDSLSVTLDITVDDDSGAGRFHDEASVTAVCEGGPVDGSTDVTVPVELDGGTDLDDPVVELPPAPAPSVSPAPAPMAPPTVALPRTGGGGLLALLGLGLAGLALATRRRTRRG